MHESVNDRLERWGLESEAATRAPIDERGPFLVLVRGRARARLIRRAGVIVGGAGLVAAAVTLTLLLRPPTLSPPHDAPSPIAQSTPATPPTIAAMHAAASGGSIDAAVPLASMGPATREPPLRAGAGRAGKIALELLQK